MKRLSGADVLLDMGQIVAALLLLSIPQDNPNIIRRGRYDNSLLRFTRDHEGRVAFIGGSITRMNGYRPMVAKWLQERFPETKFDIVAAGISSTCSTTGAFRLPTHVFGRGPVDLLFVEFAVNDDQDAAHPRRDCIRGMEGIIRQARRLNRNIDIVVTFFVNPRMLEQLREGKTPLSMAAHGEVLKLYNVTTIHLAREVAQRINDGKMTWKEFGGTHPKPAGNQLCAKMIGDLLTAAWKDATGTFLLPHGESSKPLDFQSYYQGHFVRPDKATSGKNWSWAIPKWKSLPGNNRSRFNGIKLMSSDTPGANLVLEFEGRGVGAYVLAGPDAGIVEASVDNGPVRKIDLYHRYSKGLHYPRTVMFDADLKEGKHVLRLEVSADRNPKSKGTAIRILQFAVNGP